MRTSKSLGSTLGTSVVRANERLVITSISMPVLEVHSPRATAIRHVYADALLAGAGRLTRTAFHDAKNKLGSEITVTADGVYVHITLQCIDTTLQKSLTLVSLMMERPQFLVAEIKRIKQHLINNAVLAKEDARSRAVNAFYSALTNTPDPRHPFSIDALLAEIPHVTKADLRKLHAEVRNAEWMHTTGGSAPSCTIVTKAIARLRRGIVPTPFVHPAHTPRRVSGRAIELINIPHKHNIEMSIGTTLPILRTDPLFSAFTFGMSVLAIHGGFSGRLMSIVREKEGLTYMIYGSVESTTATETGFWRIGTFFNPRDVVHGVTSTLREITRMHRDGITDDELRRFRAILKTRYTLIEDSLIKQTREAHSLKLMGITREEYNTFKLEIARMSREKVSDAMRMYLNPKSLVITGAGPVAGVEKDLQKFRARFKTIHGKRQP